MPQLLNAIRYISKAEMKDISQSEEVDLNLLQSELSKGHVVIVPGLGTTKPVALGSLVSSKVLCNIGTSIESPNIDLEITKANEAISRGASIICDQSVGPNVSENRIKLIESIDRPVAAIPLYQNAEMARRNKGNPLKFDADELILTFEETLKQGITAPGIHTMTRDILEVAKYSPRIIRTVSRGGTILSQWIENNDCENPYIQYFDDLLNICSRFDVPLTLVCSTRSGAIHDGFDRVQKAEFSFLSDLVDRAHSFGIGIIIDGLGHIPMDEIPEAISFAKKTCKGVPIGVMGPVVIDRGLGYEHIVNSIGTAIAVQHGANYCNACSRTEHIGLPTEEDIPDAIGSALIATYAGDISRNKYRDKDLAMSRARKENAWGIQLSLALEKIGAKETFYRVGKHNKEGESCSICGDLCPFTLNTKYSTD